MSERDDPFGDKAWLEERRQKGRKSILEEAEDWKPDYPRDDAGADEDEAERDERPPVADHVTIPRIVKNTVRWVPISMPPDPPITCLGKMGRTYFYLSPLGELVGLQDSEHGQAHIEALWAPKIGELHRAFPQFDQGNRFKGFQAQYARAAMFQACGAKGLFDAHERVRGLGCWRADDGQLVQHLGDRVLVGRTEHKPGEIDGYVYPGRPAMPPPKAGGKADCEAIYQRFQLWNFERGEVDARLLLGQLAAGVLGAAIDWRPMAFLTGDAGTGKSTLQKNVRALFPRRIISTVDASEAALRALLGQDALCVSFDEIEADAHSDRAQAVMKLARTSASGDDAHRSSADQVARSFTLRGSFLFSAIVPPSMRQQDMQRFAFLRLRTLKPGSKLPPLKSEQARDLGAGLVGRITEAWPRWETTLAAFIDHLQIECGHEHRGAMQFGTMLAAAHLLLEDAEPFDEDLARWCEPLHRDRLFEYENSAPAWLTAWRHIMTAQPDAWRSHGSPTVEQVIRKYLTAYGRGQDGKEEAETAHRWLNQVGLAIVRLRGSDKIMLAIAPKHSGMAGIFRGSDFEAKGGEGAWNIPLRGAPKLDEGGVLHVEKVPRLGRQKCPLYWIDGEAVIAGERVPIFDRGGGVDEVAGPASERLAAYYAELAAAPDLAALEKIHARSVKLRDELDEAERAAADEAFNARWIALEERGD